MENQMGNVIELDTRRNTVQHQDQDARPNLLECMWLGLEKSKWGSLAGLATEVANQQPLWYLNMLSKYIDEPTE